MLGKLLAERKEKGAPLELAAVKVKCEMLIPAADHCALLTSWKGLVGEGVTLEYERTEVEKLPRCRRRDCEDEDEWDHGDENEDDGGGDKGGDEDEEVDADDLDDCRVGWDGWPEKWPERVGA